MNKRNLFLLSALLAAPALCGVARTAQPSPESAAPALPPAVRAAMDAVRADGLREHVRYLADDKLEGRDTGSPGGRLAAEYLAAQLKELGIPPANRGSYFHEIPFVSQGMDEGESRLRLRRDGEETELRYGPDFLLNGFGRQRVTREAPLVFAGYGISAPEFKYDDYRDLDVRGKMVVLLAGEPASEDPAYFEGTKDTKHASGQTKIAAARSRGAAGVITILVGPRGAAYPWDRARAAQTRPVVTLPDSRLDDFPALLVRRETGERLLAGAASDLTAYEKSAAERDPRPFALPAQGTLTLKVSEKPVPAPNVVGLLEGSDPELKKQVVVYTAHYDHVGKRTGEGDVIFNGAWDNASGTAGVLETARAFSRMKPAPKRSLLFLFVTGEEKGLLGSRYYVRNPLVPVEQTAANINLDMTDIFGVPKEFVPLGADRSTLQAVSERVSREMNLKIGADPTPELNTFVRSDQFSFAQAGVPCLFLRWSNEYEDITAEAARAKAKEKLDKIYHQVGDEFDPTWSWEGMRRHTQVAFLLGLHVANDAEMPSWKAGDSFDKPRGVRPATGAE